MYVIKTVGKLNQTSVNPSLWKSVKLASLLQPIFASYLWIPKFVTPIRPRKDNDRIEILCNNYF